MRPWLLGNPLPNGANRLATGQENGKLARSHYPQANSQAKGMGKDKMSYDPCGTLVLPTLLLRSTPIIIPTPPAPFFSVAHIKCVHRNNGAILGINGITGIIAVIPIIL